MIRTYIYYITNAAYQMSNSYLLLMAVAAIITDYPMPLYYVIVYLFVVSAHIGVKYLDFRYKPVTLDIFRVVGSTVGLLSAIKVLDIVGG